MSQTSNKPRVVMARSVARRWLEAETRPEHRLTIFVVGRDVRGIPNLLRSFRDAKLRIGSVDPIRDLGVQDDGESVTIWTTDHNAILRLAAWFEQHDYDTSGVW